MVKKYLSVAFFLLFLTRVWAQEVPKPETIPTPPVSESAPALSIVKAAELAQAKLDEMKLPAENFIRSISYNRASERDTAHYSVFYTPYESRRLIPKKPVEGEPVEKPKIIVRFIRVDMDGSCTAVEKIAESGTTERRRIISLP